jgi:hypothetical protein
MQRYRSFYGIPKKVGEDLTRLEVMPGSMINGAVGEAIDKALVIGTAIQFEFNGVTITVRMDSDPELIHRDCSRALSGYIEKCVGPYPNPDLTDEEKASDARIEAENDRRRQEQQAQNKAEARVKRKAVEAKLVDTPEMELFDEKSWREFREKNQDGYGGAVVTFSERWARLMQFEMANGSNLENVAEATSREADLEGITGFMYGCAVSTLVQCWKHGEQLRHWHNLDTQVGDEGEKANKGGGVLNPALLKIQS